MSFLYSHVTEIVVALAALVLIQLFTVVSLNNRVQALSKQLRNLMTGATGEDLESLLQTTISESQRAEQRCDAIEVRLAQLVDKTQGCLQHVGMVRFDAFHDVSGQQSFSLAMLDGDLNGAIITALFGRQESRCFGKAVLGGKTQQQLSDEEENALHIALEDHPAATQSLENEARRVRRRRRVEKRIGDFDDEE